MLRTSFLSRLTTLLLVAVAAFTLSVSRQGGSVVLAEVLGQIPTSTDATTHVINYQGRLVDPTTGAPKADGTYSMTFRIYDAATVGTTLWTEIKDITVSKGLFSTLLGDTTALPATVFDGNDRWLGVKVGADAETAPRMRLAFVPYATWAINAAALGGQASAFYRNASNLNAGTVPDARLDPGITRDGEVIGIVTGADGTGSTLDADLLDGQNSTAFAAASHNHSGANITSGTVADARIDSALTRDAEVMPIVTGADGAGSGLDADLLDGQDSAAFAVSTHNHDAAYVNQIGPETINGGSDTEAILYVKQTGSQDGIFATTESTSPGEAGVHGRAGIAAPIINSAAGVFGDSASGRGVIGTSTSSDGVLGYSTNGTGVTGQSGNGNGVEGLAAGSSGAIYGVRGISNSSNSGAAGVRGESSQVGVFGNSTSYVGVWGESAGRWGVYGRSTGSSNSYGVYGTVSAGTGNYAGYFSGNVNVTGSLSKGGGSFKIDHPLDPENKYLYHSFVESPDMMNVYNGNVALDANGEAWVQLPTYFEALNRDFRYQLTAIGAPGPNLYIAEQVQNNSFKIAGGAPNSQVSWQVTGIRQDAFANANRIQVEVEKPAEERGTYLYPEAFGRDRSMGTDYRRESTLMGDPASSSVSTPQTTDDNLLPSNQ